MHVWLYTTYSGSTENGHLGKAHCRECLLLRGCISIDRTIRGRDSVHYNIMESESISGSVRLESFQCSLPI